MAVVVVTDSSSRLQSADLDQWRIRQVPLHVLVDGIDLRDGIDEVPGDIHERAQATTAGATPAELADSYAQALAASGGDGVVAVHISAALSSTLSSAVQAAREFGPSVRVVNSRSAGMGTGFVALAAARSAASGADLNAVEAEARSAVPRNRAYIAVHRLDNLRRGGRIGTAASWLGTALSLKPLLALDGDGRLVLSQRIRTVAKVQAALIDQIVDVIGENDATVVVHHVGNPSGAADVAATLGERLPQISKPDVCDLGPVLAVHLGAGAIGVVVRLDSPPAHIGIKPEE